MGDARIARLCVWLSHPLPTLACCRWYNEAGMWLAVQSEVQDEAAKLKEAMEASLREQQAAREAEAAAPPLALLSEERLRKKFQASVVLKHLSRLGAVLPDWVLFSDRMPLRKMVKHKVGGASSRVRCWRHARARKSLQALP